VFLADVDAVGLPTTRWTVAVDGAGWTLLTDRDPTETP
jgi:hypothetical protein